jgi:hypothetical protein
MAKEKKMFLLLIDGYLHFRFLMLFTSTLIFPNSAVLYLFFNRQGAIREPTAVLNMCLSQALKVTIHSVDGSLAKICSETSIKRFKFSTDLTFSDETKKFSKWLRGPVPKNVPHQFYNLVSWFACYCQQLYPILIFVSCSEAHPSRSKNFIRLQAFMKINEHLFIR